MKKIYTTTETETKRYFDNTTITYVSSDEELAKLHTKQLLKMLNSVRAEKSYRATYIGDRCCEMCNEYVGGDWEKEVQPHVDVCEEYIKRIKAVLDTREHVPNKQEARAIRQAKAKQKR